MGLGDIIAGVFALGMGTFMIGAVLFGLIEFIGRLYGTFRCLARRDLSSEQRIIYLALIWFIPLGWLIYFLLGTERTQQIFADLDVF